MYQLKFTLKQHTPIIHFQHDQDGATLRTSEVKPKLDRFIIKQMGGKDKVPKEWVNNEEKGSLNYKLRIEANGKVSYFLPLARFLNNAKSNGLANEIALEFGYIMPSCYFGNEDKFKFISDSFEIDSQSSKLNELRFGVMNSSIEVSILNDNIKLNKWLEENLNEFFLVNNFGTRHDKGYGSFTIKECLKGEIVLENLQDKLKDCFIKKRVLNNRCSQNDIFNVIDEEYQLLKSGINLPSFGGKPERYEKSELFKYFIENGIRWEKRKIKQELNSNGITLKKRKEPLDVNNNTKQDYNSYRDIQQNNYQYIRALLGLGEHVEYLTENGGRVKVKITHKPQNGEEKIDRFQSPIIFKVIDNIIYVGISHSVNAILNKKFNFSGEGVSFDLMTPDAFNINEFLEKHLNNNWKKL